MDSAGAGLMLRVSELARQFDTQVAFTGAQPNVRNVLRLAQLDRRRFGTSSAGSLLAP